MATIVEKFSTDINVMIIGETGCGKSTLINYLTNLFHNGSLMNLKIAIPTRYLQSNMSSILPGHQEDRLDDITLRKTSRCTKYQYKVQDVYFNFYDTPGINDTGGYLADNENLDRIFECMQSFDSLTALVLLLNGTQARLTINIQNILERFRDRLPDVFYSNLILILTNCNSHTVNFDSGNLLNHPPIFYMQNSAFSSDPQTWSEQTRAVLERDWTGSMQTMNDFLKTLILLTPIATKALEDIDQNRNTIRSVLHESRLMIMELQHIEDELTALEQASAIHSENMEKHTTQNRTVQVNEIVVTPYHNTLCIQCNMVCHERCSLTETSQTGEDVLRSCSIMDNGRCTICPGGCSYDTHYHDRRLIRSVSRTLKVALSSLSDRYLETERERSACELKCQTIQGSKRFMENLLQEQCNKIRAACREVQKNCQGFNIAEEFHTFIRLLRNDINSLQSSSVIRKATEFIEELEQYANDRSTRRKTVVKRKTPTSKKRKQVQTVSIANKDDFTVHSQSHEDDPMTCSSTSQRQALNILKNRNYDEYTIEQLLDLTRQSIEKQTQIAQELNRRCEGMSIGYLSPPQLLILCEYYAAARLLKSDELIQLQTQLRLEIQGSTDSNPFDILAVPTDKLLHLSAIQLCLENTDPFCLSSTCT